MSHAAKNNRIRESMRQTKARHADMACKVFEVKVNERKMSHTQKEQVNQYFCEAKWRRNSIIADFENADRNAKTAMVKVGNRFEERAFRILGSQVKQDIYDNVRAEIQGLATKKAKGEKAGKLKYKSYCNSIPLRQYGTTYKIDFFSKTIRVQNIKKPFKVHGLNQIPADADITNAKFIRKASGLYFHITCYTAKEKQICTGRMEGIDFGIGHTLTFTDGTVYDLCVPESKGVKLAAKRMNKALARNGRKKTANHGKRVQKLRAAYEKDVNRRKEKANQIVHQILVRNDLIAIQDEMIHNWHSGLFGKQVQHSAMGLIKAKLKTNSKVHIVDRSYPSTQICPVCGCLTKHPLDRREYTCSHCGYHHDSRDQKSAISILEKSLFDITVSPEQRAQSLVEVSSSAPVSLDTVCKNPPVKQEAQVL